MKKLIAIGFIIFCSGNINAQQDSLVRLFNPPAVHAPKGYSHIAQIDLGTCTMLIISGQVALDKNGGLVGRGDLALQAEQVFKNLRSCVESAGGTMNNIVKFNFFLLDVSQVQKVRDIRDKFINPQTPPASTLVQVSRLFREDILIEVEATAIIPKK